MTETSRNSMNYENNIIPVEVEDCVVEVDTTPEKITLPKEESITDTLYMRAQEQRDMRIEDQQTRVA